MPFDFSRFLAEVETRFRRVRGLSVACRLLCFGSIVAAVTIPGLRWWLPSVGLPIRLALVLAPLLLAGGAFLAGWRRRPDVPHLLMQLDDALDSGARISSLYEVRVRQHAPFIRARLENTVSEIAADWKRGIRLPRRSLGFLSAGVAGLLIACALILVPFPSQRAISSSSSPEGASSAPRSPASLSSESAAFQRATTSDDAPAPLELQDEAQFAQRDSTEATAPNPPSEELTLDSILEDLRRPPEGLTQVAAPPTREELAEIAESQEQARRALSDMLKDLLEDMQNSPRPLTQQESQTLQDLASQTGDPEIEEQTNDIVDEPNPDQIGEKLQDLLEQADPDTADPDTAPEDDEERGEPSEQQSPRSTEVSGDEEAGQRFLERTAEQMEEQSGSQAEGKDESQQPSDPLDSDMDEPGDGEAPSLAMMSEADDLSQIGGDDGYGGPSDEDAQLGQAGFVREQPPSTIGSTGEFVDDFVTKGVPVEIAPSDAGDASHIMDFERMDSILQERGLPDEALDSVRKYFELITRPEGGS
jgi:hypothetical protein